MPKRIDPERKARAVRLVMDRRAEYPTMTAAVLAVAQQVGVGKEALRRWVNQAEIDGGQRPGLTSEEQAEIKAFTAKVRRLEEDNEILRRTTVFFAGELDALNRWSWRSSTSCAAKTTRSSRSVVS